MPFILIIFGQQPGYPLIFPCLPIFAKKILRLKKNTFPILLTLLLGFVTITATAQSWNQKFNLGITYSSLNKQSKLASVFNLLASNDNKSVNNLRLQLSFEMHFSIVKSSDGQITLKYSVHNQKVTGNIFFRDFKVDSLLLPEKLDVELLLYENNRLTDTLSRTVSFTKGQLSLSLTGSTSVSALSVEIKVSRVVYTSSNYQQFLQTAGLINNYYGYVKIMKKMPQLLIKMSGAKPSAADFFLNYITLTRLESYIRQHNFSRLLHLKLHDPLNFEKTFGEMLRLQIRMKTLSQQMLSGTIPTGLADKEKFTRGYVALSIKAVTLSEEQQPYIAASYNEFARVFPDDHEKDFVSRVSVFYDQNIKPGQATVSQEIYKYFIDAASLKIRQQSFVRALDFLANAAYFENRFPEVKRITEFDSCLIHARDGLATSYMKVALMASENNDFQLTNRYINKASQSLNTYNAKINPPKTPPCYLQYSREMLHLAATSLKQGYFQKALTLLNTAHQACHKLPGMDLLRQNICKKLLRHKLDITQKLLAQGDITASRNKLLQIVKEYPKLCPYNSKLTQNKEVTETAKAIFQQVISTGAQLHDQNRNTQAMTSLNSAAQLQRTFSLPDSPQLNRLISETTVPYILVIADEANLEIWKKHFQKADSVYRLAESLSRHYGMAENQKVKSRLDALSIKIKVAGCQWKREQISSLFTQAQLAVKAYHIAAAKSYFLKAKQLYKDGSSCEGAKEQTSNTFRTYETFFSFTDAYHKLTLQLFSHGFVAVLPEYTKLEQQYRDEHLEKFGLPFTKLYPFVRSQHSEKLTLEAVHYFIQNKEFAEALRYLQLSGNAANAKLEQKQIALGFVSKSIRPQSLFLTQPAWVYFAKTYRKALSSKVK
jgi:hypothetical protein